MTDYIVDIDGTVADISHRIHHIQNKPKNWRAFFNNMQYDLPITPMVDLVRRINHQHFHFVDGATSIIWSTGRPEEYRRITQIWLNNLFLPDTQNLYMRPDKDNRQDYIVKEENLMKMREAGFNPTIAFEDRQQVVDMYRRNGLICCQVAPGNF